MNINKIKKLREIGLSYRQIGKAFGVSGQNIYQKLHPEKHQEYQRSYYKNTPKRREYLKNYMREYQRAKRSKITNK